MFSIFFNSTTRRYWSISSEEQVFAKVIVASQMRKKEKKARLACLYKEQHKQWGTSFAWNMKSLWCLLWAFALSSEKAQIFTDGFPKVEEKRSSDSKVTYPVQFIQKSFYFHLFKIIKEC